MRWGWVIVAASGCSLGCGASDTEDLDSPPSDPCADGGCEVVHGVPDGGCAEGFESDGLGGCVAVLPAGPCPEGAIAVPGDAACRPIMDCGTEPWGTIPSEPNRVHVDVAFAGATSDGSAAQPFTTIQEGIDAAEPGAIVAVAAGTYPEDLDVVSSPVRLWGRCPELVHLVGVAGPAALLIVQIGSSGTEVRGLDITGPGGGVGVSGATDVVLEKLAIHDLGDVGVLLAPDLGTGRVTMADLRIERASHNGIQIAGYEAAIASTVIRSTQPRPMTGTNGRGINVDDDINLAIPSAVTIERSLIEDNRTVGVYFGGSTGKVDGTLIRNTSPQASDATAGRGLGIEDRLESGLSSTVDVVGSVIESSYDVGLYVAGSTVQIAQTTVRSTAPRQVDGTFGAGIAIERALDTGVPALGTVSQSFIADNHHVGVMVFAASATLESVAVGNTSPQLEGLYGDGIAAIGNAEGADVVVDGATVTTNHRAGVAAFGAMVRLTNASVQCNALDLTGENEQLDFAFEDLGNNLCGCEVEQNCQVVSASLEAPTAVGQ